MRTRVAALISGRGSNMAALLDAAAADDFPAEIALVVSNVAAAGGLALAAARGVATATVPNRRDRLAHEQAVADTLDANGIEGVALCGYMRLLTPWFVARYAGRMLNIHPSLLPAFPGLHTHARALAAGCRIAGCTVHLVSDGMDEGPILGQAAVPVLAGDTERTLGARVLRAEHRLYPATLAAHLRHAWTAPGEDAMLANPSPVT